MIEVSAAAHAGFLAGFNDVLTLGARMIVPRAGHALTWEQLRDLMRPRCGLTTLADRRSPLPRRDTEGGDRRFFPRPEGRRKKAGRRITDEDG